MFASISLYQCTHKMEERVWSVEKLQSSTIGRPVFFACDMSEKMTAQQLQRIA